MDTLVREYHARAKILEILKPPNLRIPQDPLSPDDPGVDAKNDAHVLETVGDFRGAAMLFGEP